MYCSAKNSQATSANNMAPEKLWESKLFLRVEEHRQKELGEALVMMGKLDERQRKIVSDLTSAILKKTFLPLLENYRRATETNDAELVEAAKKLLTIN